MKKIVLTLLGILALSTVSFAQSYPVSEESYENVNKVTKEFLEFVREVRQLKNTKSGKSGQQLDQMFSNSFYLAAKLQAFGYMIMMEKLHGEQDQMLLGPVAIIKRFMEGVDNDISNHLESLNGIVVATKDKMVLNEVENNRRALYKLRDLIKDIEGQLGGAAK